jgi:hypothetical protein
MTNRKTNPIISFFRGESPDSEGRMLDDILAWPDSELEFVHDYIQWLFPLREPSAFNPDAPIVDDSTIAAFKADPRLRAKLSAAFNRMAAFYGFEVQAKDGSVRVARSTNWPMRSASWLKPGNHNMLRVTRILTSLRLLGLDQLAAAFFAALDELYASQEGMVIGPVTYRFWKSAVAKEA